MLRIAIVLFISGVLSGCIIEYESTPGMVAARGEGPRPRWRRCAACRRREERHLHTTTSSHLTHRPRSLGSLAVYFEPSLNTLGLQKL